MNNASDIVTLQHLQGLKGKGEKITCLTSYDASFARLVDQAGVEIIMVGDSLGMVLQGHESTRPVSVDDMVYHSDCVSRVRQRAMIVTDMPYQSYRTAADAVSNAKRLVESGGADVVKLEGGREVTDVIKAITDSGIGVCAHLGLLPQSVETPDGYRVQGRDADSAGRILEDALLVQQAGAGMLVLECIPSSLGKQITSAIEIPTIGIGAGCDCDGQVLVIYDMLGITSGSRPKFVKDFLKDSDSIRDAIAGFVEQVKSGSYPSTEYSY
ncbi:MAG: 3-methyl-2-oxobutanoate hydroxymethyltransferase [Gammaproteobacteria bacterium]|nr:MAG: 3-methyl-2-oxobutanoate hydroxymethyltransferase [Gammaproteobacteria bacterium]